LSFVPRVSPQRPKPCACCFQRPRGAGRHECAEATRDGCGASNTPSGGGNGTTATATTTGESATGRRPWLRNTMGAFVAATVVSTSPRPSVAVDPRDAVSVAASDELPSSLRGFTKLAPLGPSNGPGENRKNAGGKTTGLAPEEVARRLSIDLVEGANGRGGYFLTGDLSMDLFRNDCVFEDPTNRVDSLSQYQKALTLLFDPERSTVRLLGDGLSVGRETGDDGGETVVITGRLRSRGYLKVLPWKPYVKAYETTIRYTLDPATGLVARQDQTWTKGASEALRETFSPPSPNGPPPRSLRKQPPNEPQSVAALFETLNGRRPNEYSREERSEIDEGIEAIIAGASAKGDDNGNGGEPGLAGTWVLVYLQEGPGGAGIDRRIPFFPDFGFNDSFQVFSSSPTIKSSDANRVTNIGQLLGSLIDVRVSGSLRETTTATAKAEKSGRFFEANIEGGRLCFGSSVGVKSDVDDKDEKAENCPIYLTMIKGKGLFESLYLGDRLRIGQNINGGGSRVVQVRL